MIFDSTNLFSDAQAITATAASTNIIDFGATDTPKHAANAITRDMGKGRMIDLRAQVVTAFATLTSLTVAVQTAADGDEAFASPTTIIQTAAVPVASLLPGYVFAITAIPRGSVGRYLRLNYTVGGASATAGAVTAGLVFANDERDV